VWIYVLYFLFRCSSGCSSVPSGMAYATWIRASLGEGRWSRRFEEIIVVYYVYILQSLQTGTIPQKYPGVSRKKTGWCFKAKWRLIVI
jgi:hypothetical protein